MGQILHNDRDLWTRGQADDAEAFGQLFDRHAKAVYSYCFRRTADRALAEDITSIVFLEAWRNRRRLQPEGASALPLLFGISTNVLRNQRRSLRRHRAALELFSSTEGRAEPDFAEDAGDRLTSVQRMKVVLHGIRRLPLRDQEIIALCLWEDLSAAEASEALGIPEGTVRTRLFRARRRLLEMAGLAPKCIELHEGMVQK